ncbi:hypothetical protein HMPREF1614_01417 [Escherichia coli 908624]|nr:hypothetical protein HMPREF1614_01417 [Escherichia coli 908624]
MIRLFSQQKNYGLLCCSKRLFARQWILFLSEPVSLCFPNFTHFAFSYFICMINHILEDYFSAFQ